MKLPDIKVKIEFTEGYEQRFTKACIDILKKRERREEIRNEESREAVHSA